MSEAASIRRLDRCSAMPNDRQAAAASIDSRHGLIPAAELAEAGDVLAFTIQEGRHDA